MGEIADVVGGGTPDTRAVSNFEGGSIPWITPADLSGYTAKYIAHGARLITDMGIRGSGARMLPAGAVLFSSRAPIGYVAIASAPLCTNQGFKSFVLQPGIDPEYVYYYLKSAKEIATGLASGTTFLELSGAKAASMPIPIAPTNEQFRIVAELEKQFSRLDAAVAALKRVRVNLKRYRASVLRAAWEGRLISAEVDLARQEGCDYEPADALLKRIVVERRARWEADQMAKMRAQGREPLSDAWRAKYPTPEMPDVDAQPELPGGWLWTSLGALFDVCVGATPSRRRADYWDGDVPWVSSGEVAFCRIRTTRETITQAGLDHTSTKLHPPGTVLLGMIGEGKTRGQVAILAVEACNNQNCAALRVTSAGLPPEYIYHYLTSQYEQTRRVGSGNNQPALNKARVEMMLVPLPPLAEQRRIVAELERRLSIADKLVAAVASDLKRAERLRQAILQRAFSGRLVAQDPSDEPAAILLERIRVERLHAAGPSRSLRSRTASSRKGTKSEPAK